jgi:hypothetical protein
LKNGGAWNDAAKLALLTLFATPLTILVHELGHFLVPLLSGLPAQLQPTTVSGGALLGRAPSWLVALQAGGGPLVTLIMGVVGALLFSRDPRRLWALAFAFAAVSRFIVTAAWLGLRLILALLGQPYQGQPNFDEYILAGALGLPALVTSLTATFILGVMLYWLLGAAPSGRRLLYLVAMTVAAVVGNILWPLLAPAVLATV